MKIIKYSICTQINRGTSEHPLWEEKLSEVKMVWSESNEELAKAEAHNGIYSVEEGTIDVPADYTINDRITEMEEALDMLLSGVTE